jgi:6-phosphogluconolactonase
MKHHSFHPSRVCLVALLLCGLLGARCAVLSARCSVAGEGAFVGSAALSTEHSASSTLPPGTRDRAPLAFQSSYGPLPTLPPPAPSQMLVYIGTYTQRDSKGIYVYRLDLGTGQLTPAGVAAETPSPSFLAIHPNRRFLYAANEVSTFNGERTGSVSAFAIDAKTGKLTPLNQQPSGGQGPCHLVVDKSGKAVLVANYGGGSVSAIPIGRDGKLGTPTASIQHTGSGTNPQRQERPHAHSINLDAGNKFAVAADLGLDKLLVYRFDPGKGTLVANDPPFATVAPGSGPRHFAFHPNRRNAYVINEMARTVTAFGYDAKGGVLKELQTISTLPAGVTGGNFSTAEVQVHPSGKFLYGSNRGHNSIAIFSIDSKTGMLTAAGHQPTQGNTPRNFGIDPTGKFLLAANQASNTVVVFRIDGKTGALTPTGQVVQVPVPVCVKFVRL